MYFPRRHTTPEPNRNPHPSPSHRSTRRAPGANRCCLRIPTARPSTRSLAKPNAACSRSFRVACTPLLLLLLLYAMCQQSSRSKITRITPPPPLYTTNLPAYGQRYIVVVDVQRRQVCGVRSTARGIDYVATVVVQPPGNRHVESTFTRVNDDETPVPVSSSSSSSSLPYVPVVFSVSRQFQDGPITPKKIYLCAVRAIETFTSVRAIKAGRQQVGVCATPERSPRPIRLKNYRVARCTGRTISFLDERRKPVATRLDRSSCRTGP